jgi:hypothetical protein
MMNQATEQQPRQSARQSALLAITVFALGAMALAPFGCEKKAANTKGAGSNAEVAQDNTPSESDQVDTAPAERPTSRETQGDPLAGLELDESVEFPPINAPSSREIASSVAALAGAIAQGDSRALHSMLDQPSQAVLDKLVESEIWQDATDSIIKVRVCTLEEEDQTIRVGLGVENLDGAYLIGWEGERIGSNWLYAGIALETPLDANTAAQLDGSSLAARLVPEPGEIIDDTFDPTINDPRREGNKRKRGRRSGGGGGRRGF